MAEYPRINDRDFDLLKKIANNTAEIADNPGGGGISWVTAPAAKDSTGTAGQVAYDGSYFYVCVATDTWLKAALNEW